MNCAEENVLERGSDLPSAMYTFPFGSVLGGHSRLSNKAPGLWLCKVIQCDFLLLVNRDKCPDGDVPDYRNSKDTTK